MKSFLNIKTHASFLHSCCKLPELFEQLKKLGASSAAITDYGNTFLAIPFYKNAKAAGIKPIIGCEFFFVEDNKEHKLQRSQQVYHITLIAKNNEGFKNINRLITESNKPENFFYKPRIDFNLLNKYKNGVIVLTGNHWDSIVSSNLFDRLDSDGSVMRPKAVFKAESIVRKLISIFGSENIFFELQNNGYAFQNDVNDRLRNFGTKYNIKCVATNSVHYINKEDYDAHKTLMSMGYRQHNQMTTTDFSNDEFYLKSLSGFSEEEINNNDLISELCNVDIDFKVRRLPSYKFLPAESSDSSSYLRTLCEEGLKKLNKNLDRAYIDRLNKELSDINEMNFNDYFLIVREVSEWAIKNDILLAYGRGSAGGSLVSYCLGITSIDPIKYNLLWERFLNKGRGGLPDIDMDFPRSKRSKIISFISERFGSDIVAQIVTFGALKARAVLKEVLNVFNVEFSEANYITSLIPLKNDEHQGISLEDALSKVPKLKEYEKKYPAWFNIAKTLEGCYKTIGTHASAVVISDKPFEESDYPLYRSSDESSMIFGYDMVATDSLSLLKLDILGLNTLDDIDLIISLIRERRNINIPIEFGRPLISLEDQKSFEMISSGLTAGIFQLESNLGRSWSKKVSPRTISEISDLISIMRPGPLDTGQADEYVKVKNGDLIPYYSDMRLKDLLDPTYGQIVYQEQVMKICQTLAGMNLYDSDSVRKCIAAGSKLLTYKYGYVNIEDLSSLSDKRVQVVDTNNFNSYFEPVDKIWKVGIKPVFEITTKSGHKIQSTADHKFYINEKWEELKNIKIGDLIAVSSKSKTQGGSHITKEEIILSALLISEGYTPKSKGAYFCNTDPVLLNLFKKTYLSYFKKSEIKEHCHQGVTYYRLFKSEKDKLSKFINLGLSRDKVICEDIINASLVKIRTFLGIYLSCDGWTDSAGIHYVSASEQICRSLKRMLLRCGVKSTVYSKYNKKYNKEYWYTSVCGYVDANLLISQIKNFTTSSKIKIWNRKYSSGHNYGIPSTIVIEELNRRMQRSSKSKRFLWTDSGSVLKTKLFAKDDVSTLFCSEKLFDIQHGDMVWEEVKNIEYLGEKDVYDFSMKNHNRPYAMVNDILTHNCLGKKKPEELKKWKDRFIDGCVSNKTDKSVASDLWDNIEKYAGYSFNASHGYGYSLLSYITAYLKANFTPEFFCAKLINAQFLQDPLVEIKELINDAKLFNIAVTPPNIENKNIDFKIIKDNEISFGISAIKGIGEKSIANIFNSYQQHYLIKDIYESFLWNSFKNSVNSASIEALIKSGALSLNRSRLLAKYRLFSVLTDKERELIEAIIPHLPSDKNEIYHAISMITSEEHDKTLKKNLNIKRLPNINRKIKLREAINNYDASDLFDNRFTKISWEKHFLGIGLSGNEADLYRSEHKCNEIIHFSPGSYVNLAVTIENIKEHLTKTKKEEMAFVTAGDNTYTIDNIVVFPRQYKLFKPLIDEGSVIRISGQISDTGSVIVNKLERLR